MALVKYGGGIVQMSGSMAGTVHARNRYGNYTRARTKPVNPISDLQAKVRAVIASLTTRWSQTLDDTKRKAWILYGNSVVMKNRLGEAVHLTGFNHYIRSNVIREKVGADIVDDGPVIFELPQADAEYAIVCDEASQTIRSTYNGTLGWATEVGGFLFIFQGQPQNAQRTFFGGPWRQIDGVIGEDPGPMPGAINSPVAFAIAEGQHQWAYARIARADGRLSEPFRADTFCVAGGA